MTSLSETKPHVVYCLNSGVARVYDTYAEAFAYWITQHHYSNPYLIAQLGRVIDPSSEIVDVSE
jgi:predicted TPR repeat methyltransferase